MAVENGYPYAAGALPTPTDTPFQTPSRTGSQHTSRHRSSIPYSDISTTRFAPKGSFFDEASKTDSIHSFNNPRFSQDLDISFIAEIHALKKELESKDLALEVAQKDGQRQKNAIGELEEAIDALAAEVTQLREDAKIRSARQRSLEKAKRTIQDDSMLSLNEIASERDNAMQREIELKRTLEMERTKKRSLESDLEMIHQNQESEIERLSMDKRGMERKNHILETRIKTLVSEMNALQAEGQQQRSLHHGRSTSLQESESVKGHERGASRSYSRAESRQSNRSGDELYGDRDAMESRASRKSGMLIGENKLQGLSLAEELEKEDSADEDEIADPENASLPSPGTLPEEIMQKPRYSEDTKARKLMGLTTENSEYAGDEHTSHHSMGIIMDYMVPSVRNSVSQYADASTQFTPPPSPKTIAAESFQSNNKAIEQTEPLANQSRKRVSIPAIFTEQTSVHKRNVSSKLRTVSASCQTDDSAQSDQSFSESSVRAARLNRVPFVETSSVSTQTTQDAASPAPSARHRLSPTHVPVIAIHPPSSRPPSSHTSVVLPPQTRNAACQVSTDALLGTKSSSMQTEEIRVDRRPIRLPSRTRGKHAVIQSRSPARARSRSIEKRNKAVKSIDIAPPGVPRRTLRSPPPLEEEEPISPPIPKIGDAYPGQNDDGPLTSQSPTGPRRPVRSGSILAGFDDTHDKLPGKGDDDSDDGFLTGAPVRKTLSKVHNSWKLVPQSDGEVFGGLSSSKWALDNLAIEEPAKEEAAKPKAASKTTSKTFQTKPANLSSNSGNSKEPDVRRAALVSSGRTAHTQRSRAPNEPGAPAEAQAVPPFPVPTRSSSRKIPISASDGAASPTPYSTSFFTARRTQESGRPRAKRSKILRKVQSAAAVTKSGQISSNCPPPLQSQTASVNSSGTPTKPIVSPNQFILPRVENLPGSSHGSDLSEIAMTAAGETLIESTNPQTTVVDAIAQTMVGEWMWKYVRKRTSFGVTENAQADFDAGKNGDSRSLGGIRHKRWVWLAPYERSVIWSSKQPTSGPALLGKGGRKLTIQSVLDVKDDTPVPKNSGGSTAFDRSILILTPERALKFTAVSRERHYIWLTALSFLSHSTQGIDDLAVPDPIPQPDYQRQQPPSREYALNHRRSNVRDSIRLAKARSRPSIGPHSISSPPGELERSSLCQKDLPWDDVIERPSEDAAEPPHVPRMTGYTRRRSSTGPRVPLGSLNSYHNNIAGSASTFSLHQPITSTSEKMKATHSRDTSGGTSVSRSTMTRSQIVEATLPPLPVLTPIRNDFFDAVGTVRMEAFIDQSSSKDHNRKDHHSKSKDSSSLGAKKESRKGRKQGQQEYHRKKDMRYWGVPASPALPSPSTTGGTLSMTSSSRWREDPFRGF